MSRMDRLICKLVTRTDRKAYSRADRQHYTPPIFVTHAGALRVCISDRSKQLHEHTYLVLLAIDFLESVM